MTGVDIKSILRKLFRWLVPLGISGLALWLVLRGIEMNVFISHLSRIGWQTYLFASLVYFISFSFRAFCWYILLRQKVSYKVAFFTMGAGYLLNNIFPFRLGEIGRAVLLDDPKGVSGLSVLSSILVERMLDVFLAAMFMLLMLPRIFDGDLDQQLIVIALILAAIGLTVLFLIARFRNKISAWMAGWKTKSKFIMNWFQPKVIQLMEGLSIMDKPVLFLAAFGSLVLSWFLAFGQNFIVFRSIYPAPPFWWMIFVLSAAAFGAALPSAPAGWGVFEGVKVAAFALLGVEAELAFTLAIVVHLMAFVYASLIGLIGLRMQGEALISFYQRVIRRKPEVQMVE